MVDHTSVGLEGFVTESATNFSSVVRDRKLLGFMMSDVDMFL